MYHCYSEYYTSLIQVRRKRDTSSKVMIFVICFSSRISYDQNQKKLEPISMSILNHSLLDSKILILIKLNFYLLVIAACPYHIPFSLWSILALPSVHAPNFMLGSEQTMNILKWYRIIIFSLVLYSRYFS